MFLLTSCCFPWYELLHNSNHDSLEPTNQLYGQWYFVEYMDSCGVVHEFGDSTKRLIWDFKEKRITTFLIEKLNDKGELVTYNSDYMGCVIDDVSENSGIMSNHMFAPSSWCHEMVETTFLCRSDLKF